MRLNRLEDDGGRAIIDVLRQHPRMDHLNLSHNALGTLTAKAIAKLLAQNTALRELDICGNEFGQEGGQVIRAAVASSATLEVCSIAMSGAKQADVQDVQEVMHTKAEAAARKQMLKSATD
jgi:Ran GTPase-activating protein (RanGAP) involved in mRNA processing and transport